MRQPPLDASVAPLLKRRRTRVHSASALLLAPLLLSLWMVAACGGGGGEDTEAPAATPTAIPTATPLAAVPEPTIVAGAGAAPAPRGETSYIVEAGDTLSAIAERFDTTVEAIMEANELTNPNDVFVDQELTIPGEEAATPTPTATPGGSSAGTGVPGVTTYEVQPGDSALAIATAFGVTLADLAAANDTTEEALNNINVGDILTLPRPR